MKNIAMGLVVLSALGFLMAVAVVLVTGGPIAGLSAEAFPRASTNLALLAIALIVVFPAEEQGGVGS